MEIQPHDPMIAGAPRITASLQRLRAGDRSAFNDIVPLVYDDLKELARRQMSGQPKWHTLQATALVHEAFERLLKAADPHFKDRRHFLSAAVCAMRCALVDHARRRGSARRVPSGERVPLDDLVDQVESMSTEILTLDDRLSALERRDPRLARVVEYAVFGGLNATEIASALGVSRRTVERDFAFARAWMMKDA